VSNDEPRKARSRGPGSDRAAGVGRVGPVRLVAAIASGVLVFLAFPDWDLHPVLWLSLVPLLVAAEGLSAKQGFLLAWLAGFVTNAGGFHWMAGMLGEFGHLPMWISGCIACLQFAQQGLVFAIGVGVWRSLAVRNAPRTFSLWVSLWLGEAVMPMIFPWYFGNGVHLERWAVQIADLGGVHVVSALVFAVNVALADIVAGLALRRPPSLRFAIATIVAVGLTFGYSAIRIPQIEVEEAAAPKVKMGLVEGNIGIWEKEARYLGALEREQTLRHNLLLHQRMSAELEKQGVELIIWPESAYMPYGDASVRRTPDRFLAATSRGALLVSDGTHFSVLPPERIGLGASKPGPILSLASPRDDVRYLLHTPQDGGVEALLLDRNGARNVPLGDRAPAKVLATPAGDARGGLRPFFVLGDRGYASVVDPREPEPLRVSAPVDLDVRAAASNGLGETYAFGLRGAIARVTDSLVMREQSPALDIDFTAAAGDRYGSYVVAVGTAGTIVGRRGPGWGIERKPGTGPNLLGVHIEADGEMYAVGERGTLWKRSIEDRRHRWMPLTSGTAQDLLAVSGDDERRVLAVGRGGTALLSKDGGAFASFDTGTRDDLVALVGLPALPTDQIPRDAHLVQPSRAPVPPDAGVLQEVEADRGVLERDRSTPRRGFKAPLLFGAITYDGELPIRSSQCGRCFNSAVLIDGEGRIRGRADKVYLVPFGEYVPFGDRLPFLYDWIPEAGRYHPGEGATPIALPFGKFPEGCSICDRDALAGILVCYEDIIPSQVRRVAATGPNVFINMTNDAWFGPTAEPRLHRALAQMRAIEHRRWLVRSTNTGVSTFIDATGVLLQESDRTTAETLIADVPMLTSATLYGRLGDWPLVVLSVLAAWLFVRALRGPGSDTQRSGKGAPRARKARGAKGA